MTILYYKFRKNRSTFFLAIRAYTFNSIKYSFFNHFPLLILIILLFAIPSSKIKLSTTENK